MSTCPVDSFIDMGTLEVPVSAVITIAIFQTDFRMRCFKRLTAEMSSSTVCVYILQHKFSIRAAKASAPSTNSARGISCSYSPQPFMHKIKLAWKHQFALKSFLEYIILFDILEFDAFYTATTKHNIKIGLKTVFSPP